MKKSGIKDIARETNLSVSTVSRVINGKAKEFRIGEKSQKVIFEAVKKLNYSPNHAAVNLRSGKSRTIALVVPALSNPFFASLASEIHKDLRDEGYTTILTESGENPDLERGTLLNLLSRNIEGLILVPCGEEFDHIIKLHDQGLPIVCMDRYFNQLDLPYVSTDNYKGAYQATKLLIDYGHTNILAIQGVNSVPNQQRALGFEAALRDAGIPKVSLTGNDFSVQNGYLETKLTFQKQDPPTAVFAFSNTIALGCLKALKEEGLEIPDDVSVICFDDHPYLDFLSTPLSCVVQPESDIARLSVKFLFSIINGTSLDSTQVLLNPQIKQRKSIGRPVRAREFQKLNT